MVEGTYDEWKATVPMYMYMYVRGKRWSVRKSKMVGDSLIIWKLGNLATLNASSCFNYSQPLEVPLSRERESIPHCELTRATASKERT